jgi:hypothetical protein
VLEADRGDGVVDPRTALLAASLGWRAKSRPKATFFSRLSQGSRLGPGTPPPGAGAGPAAARHAGHAAASGLLQAGQHPQQARFADPAGAEDGHHFARRQRQVELLQHRLPAALAG